MRLAPGRNKPFSPLLMAATWSKVSPSLVLPPEVATPLTKPWTVRSETVTSLTPVAMVMPLPMLGPFNTVAPWPDPSNETGLVMLAASSKKPVASTVSPTAALSSSL